MCVHVEPEEIPPRPLPRAGEHTCTSRTDAKEIRGRGGARGETERERGRSDYRARVSGCPRRVRPDRPSSPSYNPPGFTFPGTRPPRDYRWLISARQYPGMPHHRARDTLEVGTLSGPGTSGGFKDLCYFYIKRVLIPLKRPMIFVI